MMILARILPWNYVWCIFNRFNTLRVYGPGEFRIDEDAWMKRVQEMSYGSELRRVAVFIHAMLTGYHRHPNFIKGEIGHAHIGYSQENLRAQNVR